MQRAYEELGRPTLPEDALEKAKADAAEVAAFADTQRVHGAPYLYGLCVVRLWTLLEAAVDELVVSAMHEPLPGRDQTVLAKLKGPLIEFRASSPDEQVELLAETLKHVTDAPLKLGVGRFEAVLGPLGLGGSVDEHVRRTLFELSQIRNCVVHKSGKVDRRLTEACPWLKLSRGEVIHVQASMVHTYLSAAYWYLLELRCRIDVRMGKDRRESSTLAQVQLAELLSQQSSPDAGA